MRKKGSWPTIFLKRAHSSGVRVSALAITGITFTWEEEKRGRGGEGKRGRGKEGRGEEGKRGREERGVGRKEEWGGEGDEGALVTCTTLQLWTNTHTHTHTCTHTHAHTHTAQYLLMKLLHEFNVNLLQPTWNRDGVNNTHTHRAQSYTLPPYNHGFLPPSPLPPLSLLTHVQ